MRYFYPLGVVATTSALLLAPTTAPAQQGDLDAGFGIQNNGSPAARAQARRQKALTPPTEADGRTTRLDDEETPTPWFLEDSVQNELGIEDPDLGPLYDDYDAVWRRHKERQAKIDAAKTDEEKALEQREKLAREYRNAYRQDVDNFAQQNFNEQQRQRYQQLQRQYQGVNAFSDPDYVEYFGFDSRQRAYIARLQDHYNRRMAALRSYNGDPAERMREFRQLREQTAADLDRILTDEQRQAMAQANGNPFSFSDESFFGTASDLDSRGNNSNFQNRPGAQTGTPGTANPGSGVGLPQNAAPGSGIGTPQPNAPGAGTGPTNGGGPGGTAGDLDGGSSGGSGN